MRSYKGLELSNAAPPPRCEDCRLPAQGLPRFFLCGGAKGDCSELALNLPGFVSSRRIYLGWCGRGEIRTNSLGLGFRAVHLSVRWAVPLCCLGIRSVRSVLASSSAGLQSNAVTLHLLL